MGKTGQGYCISAILFLPSSAEYDELCPGGPGFRPNTVTVILEGNYDKIHSQCKYLDETLLIERGSGKMLTY